MSTWKKFPFAWIEVVVHRVVADPSMAFPGVPVGEAVATHPVRDSAVSPDARCSIVAPEEAGPVSGRDACRHAPAAANTIDRAMPDFRWVAILGASASFFSPGNASPGTDQRPAVSYFRRFGHSRPT
jgi:hypothetical protein